MVTKIVSIFRKTALNEKQNLKNVKNKNLKTVVSEYERGKGIRTNIAQYNNI